MGVFEVIIMMFFDWVFLIMGVSVVVVIGII